MSAMGNRTSRDIRPREFPQLNWSKERTAESLGLLRNYVVEDAQQAIYWYSSKRGFKKRMAQWLRGLAIALTGIGGLMPLVSKLFEVDGRPRFDPIIGAIFLGLAAILILLDKFFGFTSGWVRFMKAEQHIGRLLKGFLFEYDQLRLAWPETGPTSEQTLRCLTFCHTLVLDVDGVVQRETDAWVAEFQQVLKQIESAADQAAQPTRRAPPPGTDRGRADASGQDPMGHSGR
jgi:hypothetical protein